MPLLNDIAPDDSTCGAGLVTISVITFGFNTLAGCKLLDVVAGTGMDAKNWYNLLDALPDKPDLIKYPALADTDGTHDQTIRRVYAQPQIVSTLQQLFMMVEQCRWDGDIFDRIFILGCSQGKHRADVCGRSLVELLNSTTKWDAATHTYRRVFNAMHFPTHAAMPSYVPTLFEFAVKWVTAPYTIMDGGRRDRSLLYGYKACHATELTSKHFTELYTWLFDAFRSQKIPGRPREPMQVITTSPSERSVMYVQTHLQLGAASLPRPPLIQPPSYMLTAYSSAIEPSLPSAAHHDDREVDEGEDVAMEDRFDVWSLIGRSLRDEKIA